MIKEFLAFLKKYGVIGLAIAVVLGGKVNEFVSATVKDLLMPIIGAVLPNGEWEKWVLKLGPVKLALGHWLGVALDFVIVAFFVFLMVKFVIRDAAETVVKEGGSKDAADSWKELQKS